MMDFLFGTSASRSNAGLTLLRIVTGVVFLVHGYQKVFGMGLSGVAGAFAQMGAPLPSLTGPLFGVCEVAFGICVILGLLTRIGALWFILDISGAILLVHVKNGWSGQGGMEFPVLLLAASIALFFAGPGALAMDNRIAARRAPAVTP